MKNSECPAKVSSKTTLKRNVSGFGILWISIGSIIGSGWLFGAINAAASAGPASIISWIIGTVAMIVLAMSYAEVGGFLSVTGGSARFAHHAHGTTAGFALSWFAYIAGAATIPIEVEGVLQYATNWLQHPALMHQVSGIAVLTGFAYVIAFLLLAIFTVLNLTVVRVIARINNAFTWWKIITIIFVGVVLVIAHFEPQNFTNIGGFAPYGFHGIIAALCTGGVIFSFTGFEQAVQLGGETKNPGRNIPLAVIGSIVIVGLIYIFLQIAFIGGIDPVKYITKGQWSSLDGSKLTFGPFAELASGLGLVWLTFILYADAIISPGSNGLVYTTTTARIAYGMGKNRYIPTSFAKVNPKRGVPVLGVIFTFIVGAICLLPFPSWQKLVGFVTSAISLMWAGTPIALGALRKSLPDLKRPFKLKAVWFFGPVGFAIANIIVYLAGWEVNWKLFVSIAIGFIFFFANRAFQKPEEKRDLDLKNAIWVAIWLVGLVIVSYLGTFGNGALSVLPFGWDMLAITIFSFAVYAFAINTSLTREKADKYLAEVAQDIDNPDLVDVE